MALHSIKHCPITNADAYTNSQPESYCIAHAEPDADTVSHACAGDNRAAKYNAITNGRTNGLAVTQSDGAASGRYP